MIDPNFWMNELCVTLGRLAATADKQMDYLIRLGTYPLADELALEFHEGALMAPQLVKAGLLTEYQAGLVRDIDQMLDDISGAGNAPLWQADSLRDPVWEEIRNAAREAVTRLNCKS